MLSKYRDNGALRCCLAPDPDDYWSTEREFLKDFAEAPSLEISLRRSRKAEVENCGFHRR